MLISHKICLSRIMGVLPFCNHVLTSWNNKELIVLLLPLGHILLYFIVDIHIRNEVRNWGKSICIFVQLKRQLKRPFYIILFKILRQRGFFYTCCFVPPFRWPLCTSSLKKMYILHLIPEKVKNFHCFAKNYFLLRYYQKQYLTTKIYSLLFSLAGM